MFRCTAICCLVLACGCGRAGPPTTSDAPNNSSLPVIGPSRGNIEIHGGKLDRTDVRAIEKVVNTAPDDIDKRILAIEVKSEDTVDVITGEIRGPLEGNGNIITLQKADEGWKIVSTGSWVS